MLDKVKVLFLVVLYEQNFKTSETLKTLIQIQDQLQNSSLIIWDNSIIPQTNLQEIKSNYPKIKNIEYFANSNNTPLSKVYNYIFENKLAGSEYVTILDHDTFLTESLIKELLTITSQRSYNLILPKIFCDGILISPAKLYYFKGFYFKSIPANKIKSKFLTAINSCMTIKVAYIVENNFRYDENLKFYGTDDNFMKTFQENCDYAYILNSKINHKLNYFSEEPIKKKVWRFQNMMFGVIYLNKHNLILKLTTTAYVFLISIKESIKNKSLKFIYFKWKS